MVLGVVLLDFGGFKIQLLNNSTFSFNVGCRVSGCKELHCQLLLCITCTVTYMYFQVLLRLDTTEYFTNV